MVPTLAPKVGGPVSSSHGGLISEQEIRKGIAPLPLILRLGPREGEQTRVDRAVIANPLVVTNQHSKLQGIAPLQDGEVIRHLKCSPVLRLGTLIKRRSLESRIAAPGIVGKRTACTRPRQSAKSLNIVFGVEVRPLEKCRETDVTRHVVSAEVLNFIGSNIGNESDSNVLTIGGQRSGVQQRRKVRIDLAIVDVGPAREKSVV